VHTNARVAPVPPASLSYTEFVLVLRQPGQQCLPPAPALPQYKYTAVPQYKYTAVPQYKYTAPCTCTATVQAQHLGALVAAI